MFSEPVGSQKHDSKDGGDLEPTFYQGPFPSHLLLLSFCYTFILTYLVFVFLLPAGLGCHPLSLSKLCLRPLISAISCSTLIITRYIGPFV
jgi:hypothetical protein